MFYARFALLLFLGLRLSPEPINDFHTGPFMPYVQSRGDTWIATWADDDNIYSVSDDTSGFDIKGPKRNLMVNRFSGNDPDHLVGTTVNTMDEYGKETEAMSALGYGPAAAKDGRAWKADGSTCIDGVLYVFVSKHDYPWRNRSLKDHRQTAADSSIIKSTDHGRTWVRSSKENYLDPMFPGSRFGAPFFITYGKNGVSYVDRSDQYVYAISTNGFWNNGDELYLGRVKRTLLPRLRASDWEFYRGENGLKNKAWAHDIKQAHPILTEPQQLSQSSIQYIEPLGQYLLCTWHYPPNTFGGKTIWSFEIAQKPWGPWKHLTDKEYEDGFYNPSILNKFTSSDGKHLVAFTTGDFTRPDKFYKLHIVRIDLQP